MHPPFLHSTGLVTKIFTKMIEAQRPERFTQDFMASVLGYGSGSARPFIPLLKRLNFLNGDGTPTQLYTRFRNPSERPSAMLEALKAGYPTLYARNEYVHALNKDKLRDLVVEITGLERDNSVVTAIVGTFSALKAVGNVDESTKIGGNAQAASPLSPPATVSPILMPPPLDPPVQNRDEVGLNLSYTINLNLPASSDPEVFNAIFKALKENLLGK